MPTPTFRSAGTWAFTANNVANPTSLSPGAPSGVVVGDFLILIAESRSITATVSTPAGWNLVTGFPVRSGTASGGTIYVWTRIADGTANDTPSISWSGLTTGTSGDASGAGILCYQNLLETLDGTVQSSDLSGQTNTSVIPAFTTGTNNSMVMGIAMKLLESNSQTSTVATFTERADNQTTTGTGHTIEVSEKLQASAGSSGSATVTWSATTSARALTVSLGFKAAPVLVGVGALSATGFAPSVVLGTRVYPGLGASTATGFAQTISIAAAGGGSNYAITVPGTGRTSNSDTSVQNATAIWFKARVKGDTFIDQAFEKPLFAAYHDGTTYKFQIRTDKVTHGDATSNLDVQFIDPQIGALFGAAATLAIATLDHNTYYRVYAHQDSSQTHRNYFAIYTDAGSLVWETYRDNSFIGSLMTTSGYGHVALNDSGQTGDVPTGATYDWYGIGSGSLAGAAQYAEPTSGDSGYINSWGFNDQASPAAPDSGATLTITFSGSPSWTLLSSGTTASPGAGVLSASGLAPILASSIVADVGALSLAGLAPSMVIGTVVSAALGTLSATGFAPVVAVSNNQIAAPALGTLSVTGLAPSIVLGTVAYPSVGTASLTGLSATVVASDHQTVQPGAGAADVTGFAPTIVIDTRVAADVGAASLAGFAPSVIASDHRIVSTGVGSVVATGLAPTMAISDNIAASPGAGTLDVTGVAPAIVLGTVLSPGSGSALLTGFAPSVNVSDVQVVAPTVGVVSVVGFAPSLIVGTRAYTDVGGVSLTGLAPTIAATDHQTVSPGAGALDVVAFAPDVSTSNQTIARPGVGGAALSGFAPTVNITANQIVVPAMGLVAASGFSPSVLVSDHRVVSPETGDLALSGLAPTVTLAVRATPPAASVVVDGFEPIVTATANIVVTASSGNLAAQGVAPTIIVRAPLTENALLVAIARSLPRYIVACSSRSVDDGEPAILAASRSESRYLVACQSRSFAAFVNQ